MKERYENIVLYLYFQFQLRKEVGLSVWREFASNFDNVTTSQKEGTFRLARNQLLHNTTGTVLLYHGSLSKSAYIHTHYIDIF